jgi:hypothetical protein
MEVTTPTKVCTKCGVEKPLTEFHRNKQCKDGRRPDCGACNVKSALASRERMQAQDPEGFKLHRMEIIRKNRYGVTPERHAQLLEEQGGACAICGGQSTYRVLSVDHDHACCPGPKSCGECVRGLLCDPCNVGIGRFKDDPQLLMAAAAYLQGGGPHQDQ